MKTKRFGLVGLLLLTTASLVDRRGMVFAEEVPVAGHNEASRATSHTTDWLGQVRPRPASRTGAEVRALRGDASRTASEVPSVHQLATGSPQAIGARVPRTEVGQVELGSTVSSVPREGRSVARTNAASWQTTTKPKPAPPPITVSCVLHNHPYDLIDAQTKAVVEKDDWRVTCTVTWKKDKVFDGELPLARPTEFRDAMIAVDEFRTKRAPQLVKEWEQHK